MVADKDGKIEVGTQLGDSNDDGSIGVYNDEKYPSGEFVFRKYDLWESFTVKLKMLFAFPWERVKKGSVLTMRIRGEVNNFCFFRIFIARIINKSSEILKFCSNVHSHNFSKFGSLLTQVKTLFCN